ncbi:Adaptive-response sensory-kinase SasA [bioreactor metagenome]|uniref:Adaptive-response sensory-kinase SasA n=2 Tax=root TaxID=1 RepID=A0A645HHH9_9ZZZZ
MDFQMESISVKAYLKDFYEEARLKVQGCAVEIQLDNRLKDERFVIIDRTQFGRVLWNLLENSLKYAGEQNVQMKIILSEEEQKVVLRFEDNGPGVEQGALEKIFDSFYRTDPARSSLKKGSGLGLSVAREIIESFGGGIYAEASKMGGLAVVIVLSIAED